MEYDTDEELKQFLRDRGIDESVVQELINQKLDYTVISEMDQNLLLPYLDKLGDRIAVIEYCKKMLNKKSNRKQSLLDKLRQKIAKNKKKRNGNDSSSSDEEPVRKVAPNMKSVRNIEIGWLCCEDGNKYTQVRTKQGGGTRKLCVPKTADKHFILEKGKSFFFVEGLSAKGHIEDFSFDLWDFQQNPIMDNITVEEIFSKTGLTRLKFYVSSTKNITASNNGQSKKNINNFSSEVESVTESAIVSPSNSTITNTDLNEETALSYEDIVYEATDTIFETIGVYEEFPESPISFNLPLSNTDDFNEVTPKIINLTMHRGQVFEEMITIFSNLANDCGPLHIKMILPNGQTEAGEDIGGVFRDCLSEFWASFYDRCTVGTQFKVPIIRHDYDFDKWKSIAKILRKGWIEEKYLPVKLAPPFLEYCLYGKVVSDLEKAILLFISENERQTLQTAIVSFSDVDQNDLIDVMENLGCKTTVTFSNLRKILSDIGHKELIQEPMFVIDAWSHVLKDLIPIAKLEAVYKKCEPTAKNVLSKLITLDNTENVDSVRVMGYFKKYIRECKEERLTSLLRFCTGADVVTENNITVTFNHLDGISRVPIAHTCGCMLELSLTYQNFPEFRSELNSVLDSKIWIMDII